ncbi:sulfurtransferase [Halosegnis marinus]|uniref:Sulfurtransferase n=1 Tax=Halosegnis marinus TaxID=3034023 RepID=A0ABD5ZND6_9EURY|nr:rhodanese-like domain-containing protein [Halosegnis sp. DT85]
MTDVVVSADWLADRRGEVRVVDVRDAWEFEGIGHVEGATNVPFDSYRGDDGEAGKLPGADAFADLLGGAGVSNTDRVVAYDDTHGVFAARLLVTAELYGHDPDLLHLLDGDFSAWQREYPTTSAATDPDPATYEAAFDTSGPLVGIDAVCEAIDSGATLVDTREAWEYEEGHIPGAIRLDWRELVDDETRGLLPEADLRDLLAERGIHPEDRVVLYCNTARRISHTYTVLRHLGYPDLAFYEGSLTEWEREGGDLVTG